MDLLIDVTNGFANREWNTFSSSFINNKILIINRLHYLLLDQQNFLKIKYFTIIFFSDADRVV